MMDVVRQSESDVLKLIRDTVSRAEYNTKNNEFKPSYKSILNVLDQMLKKAQAKERPQ